MAGPSGPQQERRGSCPDALTFSLNGALGEPAPALLGGGCGQSSAASRGMQGPGPGLGRPGPATLCCCVFSRSQPPPLAQAFTAAPPLHTRLARGLRSLSSHLPMGKGLLWAGPGPHPLLAAALPGDPARVTPPLPKALGCGDREKGVGRPWRARWSARLGWPGPCTHTRVYTQTHTEVLVWPFTVKLEAPLKRKTP